MSPAKRPPSIQLTGTSDRDIQAAIKTPHSALLDPTGAYEYNDDSSSDWPYAAGFHTDYTEKTPTPLKISGSIPSYAAGILYRTGPAKYKIKADNGSEVKMRHWFDGITTVHRFELAPSADGSGSCSSVTYRSRRTVDEYVREIERSGEIKNFGFANGRDPCETYFRKVMSTFKAIRASSATEKEGESGTGNVGVTLTANMPNIPHASERKGPDGAPLNASSHSTGIRSLITKTDANAYQELDPETLEPMGFCRQDVLNPELTGPLSGAHARTDPDTGEIFNYNLEMGRKSIYRIWCANPKTGKTDVLARIEGAPPSYLHSLFLTQNTVVLCVWNAHYAYAGVSLLYHRNILDSIKPLDPTAPATWFVVDRSDARRGLLAKYTSPSFFAFHTVNAFEEPNEQGGVDILTEVATYPDTSVLHRLLYSNLLPADPTKPTYRSTHPTCTPRLTRYRLPLVPLATSASSPLPASPATPSSPTSSSLKKAREAEIVYFLPPSLSAELPTINPRLPTRRHRYVYGVSDSGRCGFFDGLVKVDTLTRKAKRWSHRGHTAGEPIFVPDPSAAQGPEGEDKGVLLSVVLDGFRERSYLLCLSAETMEEVGRAEVPGVVGFGFHGLHVPVGGGRSNSGD